MARESCSLVVAALAGNMTNAPLEVTVVVSLDEGPHWANRHVLSAAAAVVALGAGVDRVTLDTRRSIFKKQF